MRPNAEEPNIAAPNMDLRRALREDHERLDKLFTDLVTAFQADARQDATRLWSEFDAGLRSHLLFEEGQLFPAFAEVDPPEAAALLREHERIRSRLLDLGIGVDLHLTREHQVEEFIGDLRRHAARENALLYQWAQRELPDVHAGMLHWLRPARRAPGPKHGASEPREGPTVNHQTGLKGDPPMQASTKTNFGRELEALATMRDELRLKVHLAKRDVQDELERLETKWLRVDEELQRATAHAKGDVQSLTRSARELMLDLKQGYEGIKRRLA